MCLCAPACVCLFVLCVCVGFVSVLPPIFRRSILGGYNSFFNEYVIKLNTL